ncbi:MAG: hypothetical protein PHP62_04630 [Candidatus Moranbacteria bacterium]|nr:hypothetical protein [Candidatus Moranbacteria bacterium]
MALLCLLIGIIAFFKGAKIFLKADWFFFVMGILAIFIWWFTNEPLFSVILLIISDSFAMVMTIRKSYLKPFEESIFLFSASSFRSLISFFAIENYNATTWLFPVYLVVGNLFVVLWLIIRRRQLRT